MTQPTSGLPCAECTPEAVRKGRSPALPGRISCIEFFSRAFTCRLSDSLSSTVVLTSPERRRLKIQLAPISLRFTAKSLIRDQHPVVVFLRVPSPPQQGERTSPSTCKARWEGLLFTRHTRHLSLFGRLLFLSLSPIFLLFFLRPSFSTVVCLQHRLRDHLFLCPGTQPRS